MIAPYNVDVSYFICEPELCHSDASMREVPVLYIFLL